MDIKLDAVLAELHSPRTMSQSTSSTTTSASTSAGPQVDAVPSVGLITFLCQGIKRMLSANPTTISVGCHGFKRKTGEDEPDKHYSGSAPQCALNLLRLICERPNSKITFAQLLAGPAPTGGVILFFETETSLLKCCFNLILIPFQLHQWKTWANANMSKFRGNLNNCS